MIFEERNDSENNPIIQYAYLPEFRLSCGLLLKNVRLGFCVFSSKPSNPLIVLHPALTGSPRAMIRGKSSQGDGWFNNCLGKGKLLDTDKFTIVCVDHLGGNGATTSAGELIEVKEQLSFVDEVNLIAELFQEMGVSEIAAVIGGSIGGGQSLDWLLQERIRVRRIIDVSGHATNDGHSREFFEIQRDLLWNHSDDSKCNVARLESHIANQLGKSDAYDFIFSHICNDLISDKTYRDPVSLLGVVRKIGFLRFVTPQFFQEKWDGYRQQSGSDDNAFAELDSWIRYQGESFSKRFSLEALAQLAHLDATAPAKDPKKIAQLLTKHDAKLRGFAVEGDILFPAKYQLKFYSSVSSELPADRQDLSDIEVVEDFLNGHDHFLTEQFANHKHIFNRWLSE